MEKTFESHKINANEIKVDDIMALTQYFKVIKKSRNGIVVKNLEDDMEVAINGNELIEKCTSSSQFSEEVKICKTSAAELLVHSYNKPFSVCFKKTDDTERVLHGKLIKPEPLLGRSLVQDLEATGKNNTRLVDHRTLQWIIIDGVKYIIK